MPLIIDRRSFLKQVGCAAAALSFVSNVRGDNNSISVALLSDTHIAADPNDRFRGFSPHENLKQTTKQVSDGHFEMLLVNGDLARQTGQPGDYAQFTGYVNALADQMPLVVTMGNHDDRKNARSALVKRSGEVEPVEQKFVTTIDAGPLKFVLLDSLLATNVVPGQLGNGQRTWLADYIDTQGSKPLIVFVHHNPDPLSDGALVDAQRLLDLLNARRSVKALFFGHTHVYSLEKQNGLHLVNLPAVGYNFADGNPVGWVSATFTAQGAELKLNAIAGEMRDNGKISQLTWR
ncbi:MAG TPA: metallophosphoesterase [Bryobacteraceae bacterium]|nr:metallophosphoesterase [Bryobacteraceae bacterium]